MPEALILVPTGFEREDDFLNPDHHTMPETHSIPQSLESRWYETGSFTMHARVAAINENASSPPFILLHGLAVSSRYMVPTASLLGRHYEVYAVDFPGFGKSCRPSYVLNIQQTSDAVVSWMKIAKLSKAIFLGNSYGCQVLVDLAVRYPERVVAAILTGPTMDPQARKASQEIFRLLQDWPFEKPALALVVAFDMFSAGLRRVVQTMKNALQDPMEEKLPLMKMPTLVLRGDHDFIVPAGWAERVAALIPNGSYMQMSNAPHCLNFSRPSQLCDVILKYVNGSDVLSSHHQLKYRT